MRFEAPLLPATGEQEPTRRWAEREQSMLERSARLGVEQPAFALALERACVHMTEQLRASSERSL